MKQMYRTGGVRHAMQPLSLPTSSEVRQEELVIVGYAKLRFNCGTCKFLRRVAGLLFGCEIPEDEVQCAHCGRVTKFPPGSILAAFARFATTSERRPHDDACVED